MESFTAEQLREISIKKRQENSSERKERYLRARDEAFTLLTEGVTEKLEKAASEGRFKYCLYFWNNQSRFQNKDEENTTKLYFGNDADGKNGTHIMALMQPTGIEYEETLVAKLRDFFNAKNETDENNRSNQLRVFLHRRPTNPSNCAIYVSWDKHRTTPQPRPTFTPRGEHQSAQASSPVEGGRPRFSARGETSFRGGPAFRGVAARGTFRGRGRGTPVKSD